MVTSSQEILALNSTIDSHIPSWVQVKNAIVPAVCIDGEWFFQTEVLLNAAKLSENIVSNKVVANRKHIRALNRLCRFSNVNFKFTDGCCLTPVSSVALYLEQLDSSRKESAAKVTGQTEVDSGSFSTEAPSESVSLKEEVQDRSITPASDKSQDSMTSSASSALPTVRTLSDEGSVKTSSSATKKSHKPVTLINGEASNTSSIVVLRQVCMQRLPCVLTTQTGCMLTEKISLYNFQNQILPWITYDAILEYTQKNLPECLSNPTDDEGLLLNVPSFADKLLRLDSAATLYDNMGSESIIMLNHAANGAKTVGKHGSSKFVDLHDESEALDLSRGNV